LVQNYINSQNTSFLTKFLSSFFTQLLIWTGELLIVSGIYFLLSRNALIHPSETIRLGVATANSMGMLLVTICLGYSLGSIPKRLKNLLLSGKQITKKYMKFDIVVKKKEHTLRRLETQTQLCFGLLNRHIPNDKNKVILRRIFGSIDNIIITDFDCNLSPDVESNSSIIEENYKDMDEDFLLKLENDIQKTLYEYTKLKQKERKLYKPIHFYEYSKKGVCFRTRNIILHCALVVVILASSLVFHLSIAASLDYFFGFSFYALFPKDSDVVKVMEYLAVGYAVICVCYSSFKLEIKDWYLLVERLTPLRSLVFYIL
jgi:hypothetical protein